MSLTKQHILAEIKRAADANGGVPLGRQRFAADTGIKEADWHGRFWARWSDAIREAGFTPNALQEGYADDLLLRRLAELCIELGRFPVQGEMRLKRRSDPTFPNDRVFDRRFGTKAALAAKLAAFARNHTEFQNVVSLCEHVEQSASSTDDSDAVEANESFGFVYLLQSGRYYKIGRTNAVGRRERELAIQLPEKASVTHAIRTDDPEGIEAYWHRRFAPKRTNGEWFALDGADLRAFKRRKFM